MEYKIEKRYTCDGGIKVKYVVMICGVYINERPLFNEVLIEKDTYEEAEQYIYDLLAKEKK